MNVKEYRTQLYEARNHKKVPVSADFYDQRDSFLPVYLSMIPFLGLEYFLEVSADIPSGLLFPTGYLLFWAFYYTYYKPNFLENKLTSPQHWDFMAIPSILLGVLIWFLKVTVVELTHLVWRGTAVPRTSDRRQQARSQWQRAQPPPHRTGPSARPQNAPPRPPPASLLPKEVLHSLAVLGLKEGADWDAIHRRYRELAKQYHPDLNHDITDVGRRFMMYDAAYRKLGAVRAKYFNKK